MARLTEAATALAYVAALVALSLALFYVPTP